MREMLDAIARDSPARLALVVFGATVLFFTALLQLPASTATGTRAPFVDSLFTATSSVCVTGLVTVETATFWSPFGQFVIAIGMMVGGLGIMTMASILGMAVSRHIGLTQRMLAATETRSRLGEVGTLVRAVVVVALTAQAALFVLLMPFFMREGDALLSAIWHAGFMSVSIFNNGGFVILKSGLEPFAGDWTLTIPIMLGTIVGAVGFPVILDVWRCKRNVRRWTLTTKFTLITYGVLLVVGAVLIACFEWNNPNTLGGMSIADRIDTALLHSTDARSSGLATVDVGDMSESTWLLMGSLMFIGGGSASAAGGIKVTTLAVLVLAIVAEARGDRDTQAFGKRLPAETLRLAIAAVLLAAMIVLVGTIVMLQITGRPLSQVLFEVISAFATCGLSTGITPTLPVAGKYVLAVLMFAGRTGTMTLAAALALRSRRRVIHYPEERPVIG
ncbi:MAG: potassium transporter TrkG [Actinomycetaceae bacterium]|nr:potassium transporter TrkG [Actinomycetaceae bacterium]